MYQIDFILTNKNGLDNIIEFEIICDDWHLSDHRPVAVHLQLPHNINMYNLYSRAKDLNEEKINRNTMTFNGRYNYEVINHYMEQRQHEVECKLAENLHKNDPEAAINYLDNFIQKEHQQPRCKIKLTNKTTQNEK